MLQVDCDEASHKTLDINIDELKEKSTIYKNIIPGSFLYDYRYALNKACFEVALENPVLITDRGKLIEKGKEKLDKDGFNYKKSKSRSKAVSLPFKVKKVLPDVREKRISELEEDLKETNIELQLMEKSRSKARNVNADERAIALTREIEQVRQKKRKLEYELVLLEKKAKKAVKDKKYKCVKQEDPKQASSSQCLDKYFSSKANPITDDGNDQGTPNNGAVEVHHNFMKDASPSRHAQNAAVQEADSSGSSFEMSVISDDGKGFLA